MKCSASAARSCRRGGGSAGRQCSRVRWRNVRVRCRRGAGAGHIGDEWRNAGHWLELYDGCLPYRGAACEAPPTWGSRHSGQLSCPGTRAETGTKLHGNPSEADIQIGKSRRSAPNPAIWPALPPHCRGGSQYRPKAAAAVLCGDAYGLTQHGRISKQGCSHARAMLVEAAWAAAKAPSRCMRSGITTC